ncbi:MAG: hypothetical protein KDB88_13450 [Flavobacteriales bacterium]|nr:hypothetical protein [Flavobacteriales bacterium]
MELRRSAFRLFLIALPFIVVLGLVYLVDPYAMFHTGGPIPEQLKRKNLNQSGRTMPFSNLMWKLLEFRRDPADRILLGDSRLSRFDLDHLERRSGERYFNFGVPGGNYRTIRDLFFYADSLADLKEVVIQVSFLRMNDDMKGDLFQEPHALAGSALLYLTNRRVLEATALNLIASLAPLLLAYDELPEDHWEKVANKARKELAHFAVNEAIYTVLEEIAVHCEDQGIDLLLVQYPVHPQLREIYLQAGLDREREAYNERLSSIGRYMDLDQPGSFPSDRELWRDPLHLTEALQRMVVDAVWKKGVGQGKEPAIQLTAP